MDPNGPFAKSLIGSSIGTLIGAPIAYLSLLSGYVGSPMEGIWQPKLSVYVGCAIAGLLPISGSVIGYNFRGSGCCLLGAKEVQNFKTELGQLDKAMFKIQIVSIKF